MEATTQQPIVQAPERDRRSGQLRIPEMWAAIAISMIWLAVLFSALFGPDFVSVSAGGSATRIPSAIVVAICAVFATKIVARAGFERREQDAG